MSKGNVIGVNGNMVTVEFTESVLMNEVGYIVLGDKRLKSEVIRVRGNNAEMQVFEMTKGIGIGDKVDFTSEMLAVELGPGLLSQIYDGLQNPLPQLLLTVTGSDRLRGPPIEPPDRGIESGRLVLRCRHDRRRDGTPGSGA